MLSSRFLVASFLYIFYATPFVAADPRHGWGGNQFCQSVRVVTVTKTVTGGQQPPPTPPANNGNPSPPLLTARPGNVNLGSPNDVKNGNSKPGGGKNNTKPGGGKNNTKPGGGKNNTKPGGGKNNTKPGGGKNNTKPGGGKNDTKPGGGKNNTKTNSVENNTKTNSVDVKTTTSDANPTSTSAPPPANTGNTGAGDPSTSLTLDPSVIAKVNGKGQAAGEADSLVSPNNFIGFCVGKTLTNGKQVKAGSCNPVPMGDIPSVDNMPSAKFQSPKNFDTIAANTPFTISLKVRNLVTGTFTNAANTYYAAPQQLVGGVIQGHSHVTVQKLTSLTSREALDPKIFDFFKGLNAAANNGILTADVTKGLPAGVYRISSINSAGNHQETLGPVAQRGSFNDVIYITVTEGGTDSSSVDPPPASSDSSSIVDPTPTDSLVSSSVVDPTPTDSLTSPPVVDPTDPVPPKSTGKGGKGGKDPKTSTSIAPPDPTGSGGKKDGKGGDVVPPSKPTPAAGNDKPNKPKPDTKNLPASSSPAPPKSNPNQGANGRGGNGRDRKRMHKRLRHA